MNKTIAILLCSTFFFSSACKSKKEATDAVKETASETVQKGPQKPNSGDRAARLEEMMTSLGLSADQKTKYQALDAKYGEKMRALRDGGDRDAMKAGMRALQTEKTNELKSILTANQLSKYKEMMEARRPKRGGPRGK